MAFGFGEDKKFFGGFGSNSSSTVEQTQTAESAPEPVAAPEPAPAPVASPEVVAEEKDTMDVKIGEYTSKISDVESKIKDIYCEIGELYFELHSEDAEYDFEEMVNAIKDKNALIADFREKINEIKGIVICEKCGAETKNTSTFCMECGNKIKKAAESAPIGQRVCTNCNCFIDEGAKFCSICGYKVEDGMLNVSKVIIEADKKMDELVEEVTEAEKEPVVSEVVEPVVEAIADEVDDFEDDMDDLPYAPKIDLSGTPKNCPSCGQQLESFDIICFACGRKL